MVSRAAELAGKLLLEMKIFSPHSGPQKIGAGALEPAFATLHPESDAHTHTTPPHIPHPQHCPGTGQSYEANPARLAAG